MQIGFIVSLIFAIIITVFALKNGNDVSVDFILTKREVSQAIVIFVSAALGAIIVTLLGLVRQIKMSLKIREMSKKISALENDKKTLEEENKILENKASFEMKNEQSVDDMDVENKDLEESKDSIEEVEDTEKEDINNNISE